MAKITRFEDLIAWQKARELVRDVYAVTDRPPLSRDHALHDQLRKSALSIPSNISEGFERWRRTEFRQFLRIAKASCAELRSQFYNACDAGLMNEETFTRLMTAARRVAELISRLRASLNQPNRDAAHGTRHKTKASDPPYTDESCSSRT